MSDNTVVCEGCEKKFYSKYTLKTHQDSSCSATKSKLNKSDTNKNIIKLLQSLQITVDMQTKLINNLSDEVKRLRDK